MPEIASLVIKVDGKEIKKADIDLKKLGNTAGKTGKQVGGLEKTFGRAAKAVTGFIGAYAGIKTVQALTRTIDQYTVIENKLKLVTSSTQELAEVQRSLTRVSDDTFTRLSDNVTLYNRLAKSTRKLGLENEDLVKATKALQQTFRISGATAAEAANSAIQFSQGLASGALRGDEFRSVAEQNLRLLQLLEDAFADTGKSLKDLAAEGKLTAEKIMPLLIEKSAELDAEASNIAPTFEQAFDKIQEKIGQGLVEVIKAKSEFDSLGAVIADYDDEAKSFGRAMGEIIVWLDGVIKAAGGAEGALKDYQDRYGKFKGTFLGIGDVLGDAFGGSTKEIEEMEKAVRDLIEQNERLRAQETGLKKGDPIGANRASSPLAQYDQKVTLEVDTEVNPPDLSQVLQGENSLGSLIELSKNDPGLEIGVNAFFQNPDKFAEDADAVEKFYKEQEKAKKKAQDAAKKEQERIQGLIQSLKEEKTALGLTGVELEVYRAKLEAGSSATKEQKDEIENLTREIYELNSELELDNIVDELENLGKAIGMSAKEQEIFNYQMRLGKEATEEQKDAVKEAVEAYQDLKDAQAVTDIADQYEFEIEQLGRTNAEQKAYNILKQKGIDVNSKYGQEILKTVIAGETEKENIKKMKELWEDFGESAKDIFDGLRDGTASWGDALDKLENKLFDLAFSAAWDQLGKQMFGFGGGSGGGSGSIFDSVFSLFGGGGGGNLFGGGGGGGSLVATDPTGASSLPFFDGGLGFAQGGSMTLGGLPGTDRNILSLNGDPIARVSRGETMDITPQGRNKGGGGNVIVNMTVNTPDADSFKASQNQVIKGIQAGANNVMRRNA